MPPVLPTNDDAVNEHHEPDEQYNSGSEPEPVSWTDPEDEHEMNLQGYQMLSPTGDESVFINNDDDSDDNNEEPESIQQPAYAVFESQSEEQEAPILEVEMDSEHIEKIKSVMKNVTLPSSSLPSWSNIIPEEEWKSALLQKISSSTTDSSQRSAADNEDCVTLPSTSRTVNNTDRSNCGKNLEPQQTTDNPDTGSHCLKKQ